MLFPRRHWITVWASGTIVRATADHQIHVRLEPDPTFPILAVESFRRHLRSECSCKSLCRKRIFEISTARSALLAAIHRRPPLQIPMRRRRLGRTIFRNNGKALKVPSNRHTFGHERKIDGPTCRALRHPDHNIRNPTALPRRQPRILQVNRPPLGFNEASPFIPVAQGILQFRHPAFISICRQGNVNRDCVDITWPEGPNEFAIQRQIGRSMQIGDSHPRKQFVESRHLLGSVGTYISCPFVQHVMMLCVEPS